MSVPGTLDGPALADQLRGFLHPRENPHLIGHESQCSAFSNAVDAGRLHHAWLLSGGEGIGKATFAYHAARYILCDASERRPRPDAPLAIVAGSRTDRLVSHGSHPNVLTITRPLDKAGKKIMTVIPVDEVRRVKTFFHASPADGEWRVAIVDTADEMNMNAANALLKILEEPPQKTVFFLVSHQSGRLLPTLRSRCRQLGFDGLSNTEIRDGLARVCDAPPEPQIANAAAGLAGGSLRLALELTSPVGEDARWMERFLGAATPPSADEIHAFADRVAKADGLRSFQLAFNMARDWIASVARSQADSPRAAAVLAPLAEVWERIDRLGRDAESLNLDRKQAFLLAVATLETLRGLARVSGSSGDERVGDP